MDIITKIYDIANSTMTAPTTGSAFHLAFVGAVLVLTVLLSWAFRNCTDRALRTLTGFFWVVIVALEIYKQLVFCLSLSDGVFSWDYAWYIFPFQFCSSPLYILPIIAFSGNNKLRERCIAYMMTFSLFAGLAVFCYPGDVFTETAGICIQTMVHHGSQILMGIFYAVRYRDRFGVKHFFSGAKVFVVMSFIAMVLNVVVYHAFLTFGIDETFNMFYISPYFDCTLPLLSTVYEMIPYTGFICVYFFGFILCALIVYSIFTGLLREVRSTCSIKPHERVYMSKKEKALVFANKN